MPVELELRLTLVCYGGVSLAVYMYGINKEVLKLVRASKLYHGVPERGARRTLCYADVNDDSERETDTESVYFDLLKALGERVDLRVVVAVISGTSAGGINGVITGARYPEPRGTGSWLLSPALCAAAMRASCATAGESHFPA